MCLSQQVVHPDSAQIVGLTAIARPVEHDAAAIVERRDVRAAGGAARQASQRIVAVLHDAPVGDGRLRQAATHVPLEEGRAPGVGHSGVGGITRIVFAFPEVPG